MSIRTVSIPAGQTSAVRLDPGESAAVSGAGDLTLPGGSISRLGTSPRAVGPFADTATLAIRATSAVTLSISKPEPVPSAVGASRDLTAADNGALLECSATVTLTVPLGLPAGFQCAVIPSGTTSIASSGGALLNGATTTLTRAAASNLMFALVARGSSADSYVVTGS